MKISLYIAQSLDGYIADSENGLDWLESVALEGEDYGYEAFYQSVDALVMGRGTYEVIQGFEPWPYEGKPVYICSRQHLSANQDCTVVKDTPQQLAQRLQQEGHRHVWLVGGGQLTAAFLQAHLIDEIILSIIPVSLGQGIRLFPQRDSQHLSFKLIHHQAYDSGLVQLHYRLDKEEQ
jgi:dihydrofolate reductase